MELQGDVNFFAVDVYPEGGANPWRVMRRYNDFHDLQNSLGSGGSSFPGAAFPRKHLTGCTGAKLEGRRNGLERWLNAVLQHPLSRTSWVKLLIGFLEAGRQMTPASSAPPALAASPSAPGALAPHSAYPQVQAQPLQPSQPSQPEMASADQWIQVEVPLGCVPGQHLGVTMSNGRQVNVVVPEGVKAGDILDLEFNPATGALTYTPPEAPSGHTETSDEVVLEVQIPPGVAPGQCIAVPCPNGQNVTVAVPPNAIPGSAIQLSFDQAKGTLTPVT
jgi:hypothetical protein